MSMIISMKVAFYVGYNWCREYARLVQRGRLKILKQAPCPYCQQSEPAARPLGFALLKFRDP